MTYNYNKVSLGNGVDFSRIRKHASGGQIPKFQRPASGIGYNAGTTWKGSMFDQIKADIVAKLQDPNTSEEDKNAYVQELNELQGAYAVIRQKWGDKMNPAQFDQAVKDYQLLIINKYNYVNSKGVTYGHGAGHVRYNYYQTDPNRRTTGDRAGNDNWASSADGYFSGITSDRTLLGYRGDWDETSDDFETWQKELNGYGLETFMDTDGAYKLRFLPKPTPSATTPKPETPVQPVQPIVPVQPVQPEEHEDETDEDPGDYTPDDYGNVAPFKYPMWDTPIKNAPTLAMTLMNNKRQYDLDMKKRVPLQEALHHDFVMTNDKATTDAYNNSAARIQSQANNIASQTSNLEANQTMLLQGALNAEEYRNKGELAKAAGYNRDRQEAQNTANWNNDQSVNTANANRQNLVADSNMKIDARKKYLDNRTNALQNNYATNTADYEQYLLNKRAEYDLYQNDVNQYLADQDKRQVLKRYDEISGDKYASNAFKNSWDYATGEWALDSSNKDDAMYGAVTDLMTNETMTDREKQEAYMDLLQTYGDSALATLFAKNYNTELEDEYRKAEIGINKINTRLSGLTPSFRATHTGYGTFDPRQLGQRYTRQFFKSGGQIQKMAEGDRMTKYLEHKRKEKHDKDSNLLKTLENNRKEVHQFKKETLDSAKQLQAALKRDLDSLDKETLLLLRSVFK